MRDVSRHEGKDVSQPAPATPSSSAAWVAFLIAVPPIEVVRHRCLWRPRRALQRYAHHLGRIDDALGDEVAVFAVLSVKAIRQTPW